MCDGGENMKRTARVIGVVLTLAVFTACNNGGTTDTGGIDESKSESTPSATLTPTPRAQTISTSDEVVAALCPTSTALQMIRGVVTASGSWQSADLDQLRSLAAQAREAAANGADAMATSIGVPETSTADLADTTEEFLGLIPQLNILAEARSTKEFKQVWERLEGKNRPAEGRLRIAFDLALPGTSDDPCPAPEIAIVTVTESPSESAATSRPDPPATPSVAAMPNLTSPMVESTSDGLCNSPIWRLPDLTGPNSPEWGTTMIQVMSVLFGFNPGPIDGQYGPLTQSAVRSLQAYLGVVSDGLVGPATWTALQFAHCGYNTY